jgi:hypothetical protein
VKDIHAGPSGGSGQPGEHPSQVGWQRRRSASELNASRNRQAGRNADSHDRKQRIQLGQRAKELVCIAAHAGRRRRQGAAVEPDADHGAMLAAPGKVDHPIATAAADPRSTPWSTP